MTDLPPFSERLLAWFDEQAQDLALAARSHALSRMGFRDHVAADAGGDSDSLLRALHGEVPKVADLAQAPIDDVLSSRPASAITPAPGTCIKPPASKKSTVESFRLGRGFGVTARHWSTNRGAILTPGHGGWAPILDGNVKRVLARYHAIEGRPGRSDVLAALWKAPEAATPQERTADYTQGIMDLGATLAPNQNPSACSAL